MLTAIVIPADERQPIRQQQIEPHDLNAYRQIVGGNLEVVTLDRPPVSLYLNEEGKLEGLPVNPRATALAWVHNSALRAATDVIVGPAFIVGPVDRHGDDLTAPLDLVDLLFTTKRFRVQVLIGTSQQWRQAEMVFASWMEAYRYAARLGLIQPDAREVRVVPELDDQLRETWYQLGQANEWIAAAEDPPFTRDSFVGCYSVEELAERISDGNWSLGTAFYYHDLCFINQVNGGDEWLTIRHGIAFESMTLEPIIEEGRFASLIARLLAASQEQCWMLMY
ncbi:DUF3846 domain-containing protein [Saccharothrix texasensis]|uniref:Uncharacterized protein DUF3846 n=1 Tax=Saccharothrix texasensis TaxID=103734 RepID=A0A3N1H8X8_9PSEU|nr:DUF3846 domain-containing protein [Saccharothrix texasensis]ROP38970.1 uncharacterized protein DUF3846 [Saccharothrix texasensis]